MGFPQLANFKPSEFKHPEMMAAPFLIRLDRLRNRCGFPFEIQSDGRTPEDARRIYGTDEYPKLSAHLRGCAVDLTPVPNTERNQMRVAYEALKMFFDGEWPSLGLEIGTVHIHIDDDSSLVAKGLRPAIFPGQSR